MEESREVRTGKILLRRGRSRHNRHHRCQNDAVRRRAADLPGSGNGHRPHSFNACQNAAGIRMDRLSAAELRRLFMEDGVHRRHEESS